MADNDLLERALDSLRRLPVEDRWDDVVARAAAPEALPATAPPRRRRLAATAAVVVVLVAAAATALLLRGGDDADPVTVAPPAGDGDPACDGLRLASVTPPSAGSIEVGSGTPDGGGAPAAIGPWEGWVGAVGGEPAASVLVPVGLTSCDVLAVGHDGVTADQLVEFLAGAYLVDDEQRPLLSRPAVWPEATQDAVPSEPPTNRDDPAAVVAAFAAEVLGWDGALVVPVGSADAGDASDLFRVQRPDGSGPPVEVRAAPALGGRWWSVVHADDFGDG